MNLDLFDHSQSANENLLPFDGVVTYQPSALNLVDANDSLNYLLNTTPWQADEVMINGQLIRTKRQCAWYGDNRLTYRYSGSLKTALPWTKHLNKIKTYLIDICQQPFNACLVNLYPDGMTAMSWHSDNEKELGNNPVIASLSLGATRKFTFEHYKTKNQISVSLAHGSLLVMSGETQRHWKHCLRKSTVESEPRINLTFRTIIPF